MMAMASNEEIGREQWKKAMNELMNHINAAPIETTFNPTRIFINLDGCEKEDILKNIERAPAMAATNFHEVLETSRNIIAGTLIGLTPEISYYNDKKKQFVIKWTDKTETRITLQEGDKFDLEKAVALCFMKKALGNKSSFNDVLNDCMANVKGDLPKGKKKK